MLDHVTTAIKSAVIPASRRRPCRSPLALAALLLAGVMTGPSPARADTITYVDLTETPTLTHIGTDTTITIISGCSGIDGECNIALSRDTQTIVSSTIPPSPPGFNLAEDPQLQIRSDSLDIGLAQKQVIFFSDSEGTVLRCANVGGCQEQETGLPQGGTITWSGGGVDSIFIQSDVEAAVPEPASWLLLATDLITLAGAGLRRRPQPVSAG